MMMEWNVVVSVNEFGFKRAREVLRAYGAVQKTAFYNVLTMKVDDTGQFMEALRERSEADPSSLSFLSRLIPVTHTFSFQSPDEFEQKAGAIVTEWAPQLAGKRFHVRIHRRGFKGKLSSPEEERFLDKVVLEALHKEGHSAQVTFEDPDAIIIIETIGQRAGLSLWTREQLQRYPFIRIDN
ncbi:MAG: THUMP domain-containing protein [Nitrospirota bacterium]